MVVLYWQLLPPRAAMHPPMPQLRASQAVYSAHSTHLNEAALAPHAGDQHVVADGVEHLLVIG